MRNSAIHWLLALLFIPFVCLLASCAVSQPISQITATATETTALEIKENGTEVFPFLIYDETDLKQIGKIPG